MADDVPLEILLGVPRPEPDRMRLLLYLGLEVTRRRQPADAHSLVDRVGEWLHLPELIPDRQAPITSYEGPHHIVS